MGNEYNIADKIQGDELLINISNISTQSINKIVVAVDEKQTVTIDLSNSSVSSRPYLVVDKIVKKYSWFSNPNVETPPPELVHIMGVDAENLKKLKAALMPDLIRADVVKVAKQNLIGSEKLLSKNSVLEGNAKPDIKNYSPSGNDNLGERYGK